MYFKVYKSQLPVVEKALESAALMLGTDKSRGHLEIIHEIEPKQTPIELNFAAKSMICFGIARARARRLAGARSAVLERTYKSITSNSGANLVSGALDNLISLCARCHRQQHGVF